METQSTISNHSNVYKLENSNFFGIKGNHIYLKKVDDIVCVKIREKVKDTPLSANVRYAENEDLTDMLTYYTGRGKDESGSKKIVKLIKKIFLEKTRETLIATENQFTSQSEVDKTFTLINLIRKSVTNFTLLECIMQSKTFFPFIEKKCKAMSTTESLTFIDNCLTYIHKPNQENAKRIIFQNLKPGSKNQINVERVDRLFEEMCLLLDNFQENQEKISAQITSNLKEILKLLSLNFTNGL